VKDVYVVTVNDMFVVKAWKKDILGDKKESETSVKFSKSICCLRSRRDRRG
jgi:peroxiredoxin